MAAATYRLLGPLDVTTGASRIVLASRKQRLLLSILLVGAGRVVPADVLIDALWPEALPSDPQGALRTQVSRLRRALGAAGGSLVAHPPGYRLDVEEGTVDADRFEELLRRAKAGLGDERALLDEALSLWRGRALDEFADLDFAQSRAAGLEELRSTAVERSAELFLDGGRHEDALAILEAEVRSHPDRERARALLMRALYAAGRHTDALDAYDRWRRWLADELGLDPSPEIEDVRQQILEHSVDARPSARSLPAPVSSFVGRDATLVELRRSLRDARLVTLCGPGGIGKTRLAVEAVRGIAGRYADGVRFCDLASVRGPHAVARAIATAVGVMERTSGRIADQLVERLRTSTMLVLIDNCEHVVEAAADLAVRIVGECANVVVLCTSRTRLGVPGERLIQVPPLGCEGPDAAAVDLFTDRVASARPASSFDDEERNAVARICASLDGLPLAIELAAARMDALTPSELAEHLDQRFRLLGSPGRSDARHRSLRAVVDWSYEQLDARDRTVFERLSVFAGGFDLDAARTVASGEGLDPDDVTAAIVSLTERSLVSAEPERTSTRYRMLETLRVYGLERLHSRDAADAARDAHAAWATSLAQRAGALLGGPSEPMWGSTLRAALDDIRAAHAWLTGRDPVAGLALIEPLHWYALSRCESEIFRWADTAAAAAAGSGSPRLPGVLCSSAAGAWLRGDLRAAQAAAEAATIACRDLPPSAGRRALEAQADVALMRGEVDRSAADFAAAAKLAQAFGTPLEAIWDFASVAVSHAYAGRGEEALPPLRAMRAVADAAGGPTARSLALYFEAEVAAASGRDAAVAEDLRSAIELASSVGSRFVVALARVTLGSVVARGPDAGAAFEHLEHAIAEWQRSGTWASMWITLRALTDFVARAGDPRDAAVLYGALEAQTSSPQPYGADAQMLRRVRGELFEALGAKAFEGGFTEGMRMRADEVVAFALDTSRRGTSRFRAAGTRM